MLLSACHPATAPRVSPSPDPAAALLEKAETARQAGDRETEALALREAVDILVTRAPSPLLKSTQQACVQAMIEAGGNAQSFRLWADIEKKNGPTQEARKMKERARLLMLQQAEELAAQVEVDLKGKKPQAALCTAQASLSLYQQAGGNAAQLQQAQATVERARKGSSQPAAPTSSPSPR